MAKTRYRILTGMSYLSGKDTIERTPGDVVSDIPAESVPWLLQQGHIEMVTGYPSGGSVPGGGGLSDGPQE